MQAILPYAAALAALVLAGCGEGIAPELAGVPTPEGVEARFVPGRSVNIIAVTATDPLALRSAVLTGPGGIAVPAYSIDADRARDEAFGPAAGAFPPTPGLSLPQARLAAIRSTALIELPEPVLYAHDWRQYRIELRFANPGGEARDLVLPAPAPPANLGG
jgi:hypothetical protein